MRLEEWMVADSRLDDQQYEIFMSEPDHSSVIAGNAGSGKTVLAVHRSKRMSQLGSYVLLVFNKALKSMIESGFLAQGLSPDAAIYAWAWENRGMDLSGLVFFPVTRQGTLVQYHADSICLQKTDRVELYKRSDPVRKTHYDTLYKKYRDGYSSSSPEEAAASEAEISKFVSIDFSDHVSTALWQTYGRRTGLYEWAETVAVDSLPLHDKNRYESLSSAVVFVPYKFRRDFITLDEAQDFSKEQIDRIAGDYNRSLVFFGDSSQRLSANGTPIRNIVGQTGFEFVELEKNYRVTKEIGRLAELLLPLADRTLVARCNKNWGYPLPVWYLATSAEQQIDYLINIIRTEDLTDVAILVPTNKLVEMVITMMSNKGMATQYRYNRPLGGFSDAPNDFMIGEFGGGLYNQMDNLNFQSTLPCVLTYHSAKGTQFDTVFIPFANDSMHAGGIQVNPFYVAMTRASQMLYLLYEGKPTRLLDGVPSSYYRRSQ
jgi:superfamily I DNA/RNA helicase